MKKFLIAVLVGATLFGCNTKVIPAPTPTVSEKPPTKPTKAAIAKAPTSVGITCGPKGTALSRTIVATDKTGVRLVVRNTTGKKRLLGYRVRPYGGGLESLGTIKPTNSKKSLIYTLPPGEVNLRCGKTANSGLDKEVTLDIVNRNGYYREVNSTKKLKCAVTTLKTAEVYEARATRSEALTLMAGKLPAPGKYTFAKGPGYVADPTSSHLIFRDGKGWGIAQVTPLENLSYRPYVVALCPAS